MTEASILRVHQFPYVWERNVSPFALKLEAWLRLAGVAYEVVPTIWPGRAPKGKLPFAVDGDRTIPDSSQIIQHLKQRRGFDLDRGLDRQARALGTTLQRMFEDHFYFVLVYSRWIDEDGWQAVSSAFFTGLPPVLRPIAPTIARGRVRRMLHSQGAGRHRREELYAMARADLEAAAQLLGDKPFFLGAHPTTADAIAYGFLANLYLVPVETALKRQALGLGALHDWCLAMEAMLAHA